MNDLKDRIIKSVGDDLKAIETALKENLNPHIDLVRKVAGHIIFSGGKRLRPLLMVLSARLCNYKGGREIDFATIFEYLHAATLLHDDIIDGAPRRRGQPVANTIWDSPTVILTGDFLLARSLTIASKTGDPRAISTIANITEEMSQGEIQQLHRKGALDLSEEEYMEIIRRKTAVLFQGACRIGAMIAGVASEREKALAEFGSRLGMAFQMADDLLDYSLDSKTLGKEVGADLKEGKLTLPVIHSLANASGDDRAWMENLIKNCLFEPDDFKRLIGMLETYGGITYTRRLAGEAVRSAKDALAAFPMSGPKKILLDIADYALTRNT
jgi:octaprenyl-diphosphate synthase